MVGEINPVVIRSCRFAPVREKALAFLLSGTGGIPDGHDGECAVVIDPGRGLVGLLEATDMVGAIGIGPSVPRLAGLGCPGVHAPGKGGGRIGIAGGQREIRLGADQGGNIVGRVFHEGNGTGAADQEDNGQEEGGNPFHREKGVSSHSTRQRSRRMRFGSPGRPERWYRGREPGVK